MTATTQPPKPKGLEGVISTLSKFITNANNKINSFFYGEFNDSKKDANKKQSKLSRIKNEGVIKSIEDLASIDLCDVLNNINLIPPSKKSFNPEKQPEPNASNLAKQKWDIQKLAYDIQMLIDGYQSSSTNPTATQNKSSLFELIKKIEDKIVLQTKRIEGSDPKLREAFKILKPVTNYLKTTSFIFNRIQDARQIPNSDIQKYVNYIDRVKRICITIQRLNDPKDLVGTALGFVNFNNINLQRLQKIVDPNKLVPFLQNLLRTLNNINSILKKIFSIVKTLQLFISVFLGIVKGLTDVKQKLFLLPLPSLYSTLGIIAKYVFSIKNLDDFIQKLIKRLDQINVVLFNIVMLFSTLITVLTDIISALNIILLNLSNCDNINKDLINDLKKTINDLTDSKNKMEDFVNTHNKNKKSTENTFGGYTIEILTEQLVDEGIALKRRYGIALDSYKIVSAQSTPTFASLDTIIINEVKTLLVSKGLVKAEPINFSIEQTSIMEESIGYIDPADLQPDLFNVDQLSDGLDDPDNENEDLGLGLNAFVNKLKGGKKLRKRVQKMMASFFSGLNTQNKTTSSSTTKEKSKKTRKKKK